MRQVSNQPENILSCFAETNPQIHLHSSPRTSPLAAGQKVTFDLRFISFFPNCPTEKHLWLLSEDKPCV